MLRSALLKQYRQLSYEELAFHLEDSASFRAFARLPMGWTPKKAVLQKTISAITAASWEAINQAVVRNARQTRLEPATMVRVDSTVTEALIHDPRLFHAHARGTFVACPATARCSGMRCG